jgi:RHS repeat-associated protein
VRLVTDEQRNVVAQYDYLPFGEIWAGTAEDDSPLRFAGKERDGETGFDYFGARYYADRMGRFTTVDPVVPLDSGLLEPQLWNRYSYVGNNPLRFTDPDGRCFWDGCVLEFIGATAGAAAVTSIYYSSPAGREGLATIGPTIGTAAIGPLASSGMMVTTAAESIGSWFQTEKRPGTLGEARSQGHGRRGGGANQWHARSSNWNAGRPER